MSVAELQKTIAKLPPGQRRVVAGFVARIKRHNTPAGQRRLTQIMREMDAGNKFTMAQVEETAMRSVFGCARIVQPKKKARQILAELRGYDRAAL